MPSGLSLCIAVVIEIYFSKNTAKLQLIFELTKYCSPQALIFLLTLPSPELKKKRIRKSGNAIFYPDFIMLKEKVFSRLGL